MKKKLTFLIAGVCANIAVIAQTAPVEYAYWKFDEPTTTTTPISVVDSWSGKNGSFPSGTVIHTSNQTSDVSFITNSSANTNIVKLGNAIRFRGKANSHLKLPDGLMSDLNNFTISVYYRHIAGDLGRIFDFGVGDGYNATTTPDAQKKHMFLIGRGGDGDNKIVYGVQNGGAQQLVETDVAVTTGQFYHIVITQSGSTVTVYVDGVQKAQRTDITIKPSDLGATTTNYLGRSRYGHTLDGVLDEFKIIGRAITAAEVITLNNTGTLPVSFLDFTAKKQNTGSVLLNWSTASEKDNSHFEVLRSSDGEFFNNIANVSGSGNSSTMKNYNFIDYLPEVGINYYKLKQVDMDGKSTFHPKVLAVSSGIHSDSDVRIYAIERKLILRVNATKATKFTLFLTDMSGRKLGQFADSINLGNNAFEFAIELLSPGVYVATYESGENRVSTKIRIN